MIRDKQRSEILERLTLDDFGVPKEDQGYVIAKLREFYSRKENRHHTMGGSFLRLPFILMGCGSF